MPNRRPKDPLTRSLLVLMLGLFLLDFLFSLLFGNQNIMIRYAGFMNLVIEILTLLLVGSLIYGFYIVLKENAGQYLIRLQIYLPDRYNCPECKKGLHRSWKCCPFCGTGTYDEIIKA